jgi:Zn finger protein HypA/HybF involved in hydrogenase expression
MKSITQYFPDPETLNTIFPKYCVDNTLLDVLQDEYHVEFVTVKVKCPNCGHAWGIKFEDYNKTLDVPDRKFICMECLSNK